MIEWFDKLPTHRRVSISFWLLTVTMVAALFGFAIRG